jgi:hypothetical protein
MKIENDSDLSTKALRALLYAVAKREGYDEAAYLRALVVRVRQTRVRHHGRAPLGLLAAGGERLFSRFFGKRIALSVPRAAERVDPAQLASVIRHEMAHNYGLKHAMMGADLLSCTPLSWAAAFPLPRKKEAGPSAPAVETKLVHAEAMKALAVRRSKRATTILRKWSTRVRYYERKLAAGRSIETSEQKETTP